MDYEEVLAYYSRPEVKEEVVSYCRGRWVALEGEEKEGRVFLRYWRRGERPITIDTTEDLEKLIKRFKGLKPRTFYASINLYAKLELAEDLDKPFNITFTSPVWDVDASLESWRQALDAAETIVSKLEKEGVEESLFLKWSGRGIHVHIHERAFSPDLLAKHNPLDVAFSVVEYVLRSVKSELKKIASLAPTGDRPLKVENKIDLKRVFTAPLSLHRKLDLCCVCFKPDKLISFHPDWARPESFKHDPSWRKYEEGEGDKLAEKALVEVGGYDGWPGYVKTGQARTVVEAEEVRPATIHGLKAPTGRLGRFQVMGLLQAARYYLVTGDLEKAKSFGLNRAVFYAWAKRYARDRLLQPRRRATLTTYVHGEKKMEQIGDEGAYLSPRGWFAIGDMEQKPSDYDRQIAKRIEAIIPYEEAWKAALDYLRNFPRTTLLDQQRFYDEVYRPVRDDFLSVIKRKRRGSQATLDELFKTGGA
ncbi:MAG: hypothetical protein DRJ98_06160 [Thermoprotei archaeon]|nr:MAG: hypothetical protein DRJ98_06160 [Thermoprotei archaeon]